MRGFWCRRRAGRRCPLSSPNKYPRGLGPTVPDLLPAGTPTLPKTSFDATATQTVATRLATIPALIVIGAEAHVCVLQTVLSLRALGKAVWVVGDAIGSHIPENHTAGLARMAATGPRSSQPKWSRSRCCATPDTRNFVQCPP